LFQGLRACFSRLLLIAQMFGYFFPNLFQGFKFFSAWTIDIFFQLFISSFTPDTKDGVAWG
jgi:hypothetical protein